MVHARLVRAGAVLDREALVPAVPVPAVPARVALVPMGHVRGARPREVPARDVAPPAVLVRVVLAEPALDPEVLDPVVRDLVVPDLVDRGRVSREHRGLATPTDVLGRRARIVATADVMIDVMIVVMTDVVIDVTIDASADVMIGETTTPVVSLLGGHARRSASRRTKPSDVEQRCERAALDRFARESNRHVSNGRPRSGSMKDRYVRRRARRPSAVERRQRLRSGVSRNVLVNSRRMWRPESTTSSNHVERPV